MPPTDPILVNGEPLSICWGSNSPINANGGYGMTTGLVCRSLVDILGCRVAVSASYGQGNGILMWHGIPVYPQGYLPFGNDIHAANAQRHGAHILLTHQDVPWQDPTMLTANGTRWVSWGVIDHEPLSYAIQQRWHPDYCYQPIAVSRFGARVAREAGIDIRCIPQGVDTSLFVPGDRTEARRALGWPQDAFLIGIIAQNRGYPNRKAYPQQLRAFAEFARKHTDARIYIHAHGDRSLDQEAQTDLAWCLGDMAGRAIYPKAYDLNLGFTPHEMVLRYQALDVLLSVSMAEGFGLPIIEAQSCGVPVIIGNWTAMTELLFAGWAVEWSESEPWPVDPYKADWRLPHVGAIVDRLEDAYTTLQNESDRKLLAEVGRERIVVAHDQTFLTNTAWRSVLSEIARRIEAEPIKWHVHMWPGFGRVYSDHTIERCAVDGCPAERLTTAEGKRTSYGAGAPIVVDGVALSIEDDPSGGVARDIAQDITAVYHLHELEFQPGDVIIDVGAHVGVVACFLSCRWPETKIYAFEPIPTNYDRLCRNLAANGCTNVTPIDLAVTDSAGRVTLHGDPNENSGHYSAYDGGPVQVEVRTTTLGALVESEGITRIALLKLDCEGAEYPILYGLGPSLGRVDALVMEVHENELLRSIYTSGEKLVTFARINVPLVQASVITIPDAEEVGVA